MTSGPSKGIGANGITYNLLNLPQSIGAKNTTFTYDAAGQKLRRLISTNTTDYVNGIQYDGVTIGPPTLTFIQTEEGRALANGAVNYNYEYTLTDHLGNSRVSFDAGNPTVAKQVDDYYPFGMEISQGTISSPKNEYLYNKKELQENLGLYDYGARFYDPVIGKMISADSETERYEEWTPYNYVLDNPIGNIDPNGDTVRFAPHTSAQFMKDYAAARGYLHIKGQDEEVTQLENSTAVFLVKETDDTNGFFAPNTDSKGNPVPGGTIYWNPPTGEENTNGTSISPTTVINHEFAHGAGYDSDPDGYLKRRRTEDPHYNKEERRVIKGNEQRTARGLGEIKKNQITRKTHSFKTPLLVTDPTSNKGTPIMRKYHMQEVKIISSKKKKQ